MGCYTVPLLAAGLHFLMRRKNKWNDSYNKMLNLLLVGGAVFGVIDHVWNKELFVFSLKDVLLGVVITVSIVLVAGSIMLVDKMKQKVLVKA